ncbi:uncharacterized protein LACBIDRAFT_311150 [Laccaria bicolor S238N-H82]|uniref:Predicted protein n=1 Tax=Laccaria bicolor (strain S238N-H82 / ATCC MYA-4686) TaxID=486041 RepID=B0CZC6_LACBS|nr:uncharacterized protein LACBIDRAFT_311150 [Laccaria bicolor S238N-H82]EDR12598.1 predicted protein [Laccaria bicolor S238N-H82]|eukprot:XP_001876862.1 predicted protein [Laccaria bicolor S238N-H82]
MQKTVNVRMYHKVNRQCDKFLIAQRHDRATQPHSARCARRSTLNIVWHRYSYFLVQHQYSI